MDAAFLEAAVPEPFQIFGLPMRPFSLGHWLLLSRFDNGFISGQPSVEDTIFGALICSMTYEDGLQFLNAPDRDEQIAAWSEKLKAQLHEECLDLDLPGKASLFKDYFDAGMVIPNYTASDTGTSSVGSPWPQVLKLTLMSELGMTESEVLNRPLHLCWWDYLGWRELNNKGVHLLSQNDAEILAAAQKEADAFDAKVRANLAAWRVR